VITTLPDSHYDDTEYRHAHIWPIAIFALILVTGNTLRLWRLLNFIAGNMGDPQLTALTLTLERQRQYRLVATGPYDSVQTTAVYAVWIRR
jgi:hypothetical protein